MNVNSYASIVFLLLLSISGNCFAQNQSVIKISRSEYQEKLHGFWLGENIANWTGLITEMDKVGTPETMPFYTDEDWRSKDLKAMWGEYVPHSDVIDFYFEKSGVPWGSDDDTDIEYIYYYLYEKHHTSLLTAEQIRDGWLTHIYPDKEAPLFKKFPQSKAQRENFLWQSNQRAYELMQQGVLPPETSEPKNNAKYMMIDAQLTTEIFGLLSPARQDIALKLAQLPINVSASKEAEWISKFYVTMHSLASSVDRSQSLKEQTQWLAHQARLQLPEDSYPAKMFDFVWQSYSLNDDKNNWEQTRDAVYQRYQVDKADGYHYQDPFEAGINFAASLVSLFYGEGDIKRTIQIGSLTGWDSDNPTATWGGLLGFMIGYEKVKLAFGQQDLSDTYWIHRTRRNFPDRTPNQAGEDTLANMAERGVHIIDRVVVEQMNGTINIATDQWLIPVKNN